MAKEIERKFLIKDIKQIPEFENSKFNSIEQAYLVTSDHLEIRIRKKEQEYFLTIKLAGELEREELESKISQEDFDRLWPTTIGKQISKKRYFLNHQAHVIEIDVFEGKHEGLVLAEIEFSDLKQAKSFVAPNWLGKEVTEDAKYKNKNLALA